MSNKCNTYFKKTIPAMHTNVLCILFQKKSLKNAKIIKDFYTFLHKYSLYLYSSIK